MTRKSPTLKISLPTEIEEEIRRLKEDRLVPINLTLAALESHIRLTITPAGIRNLVIRHIDDKKSGPTGPVDLPLAGDESAPAPPRPIGAPSRSFSE